VLAWIRAPAAAALLVLGAGFARRPALGNRHAQARHARAAATVRGRGAGRAGCGADGGRTDTCRASEPATGVGQGAGLAIGGATGRGDAHARARAGWVGATQERAAIASRRAGRAFGPARWRGATSVAAEPRTTASVRGAGAVVRAASDGRRRTRHGQLDLAPAAGCENDHEEHANPAGGLPHGAPIRSRAAAAARPRGNDAR